MEKSEKVSNEVFSNSVLLFNSKYIKLYYIEDGNFIYSDWTGYQTQEGIQAGCSAMIEAQKKYSTVKMLNNNKNAKGSWTFSVPYVAEEVMPTLAQNGVQHFAWVISDDIFTSFAADKTMQEEMVKKIPTMQIAPFKSMGEALEYLDDH